MFAQRPHVADGGGEGRILLLQGQQAAVDRAPRLGDRDPLAPLVERVGFPGDVPGSFEAVDGAADGLVRHPRGLRDVPLRGRPVGDRVQADEAGVSHVL